MTHPDTTCVCKHPQYLHADNGKGMCIVSVCKCEHYKKARR